MFFMEKPKAFLLSRYCNEDGKQFGSLKEVTVFEQESLSPRGDNLYTPETGLIQLGPNNDLLAVENPDMFRYRINNYLGFSDRIASPESFKSEYFAIGENRLNEKIN